MQKLKIFTAYNLFEIFVYFFVFLILALIFFCAVYVSIKILTIEYSLATLFGILILAVLLFSCYGGMRVFIITINHIYYELKQEVVYDSVANRLVINDNNIDLNTINLIVIHHAPRYLLFKAEMKYRLKTYSKFEFKMNDKSYFISSILELPEELEKTIRLKTKEKILKRHIWMTA